MNLAEAISAAHHANEAKLAAGVAPYQMDDEAQRSIGPFIRFCTDHGVRHCPASPASIAAFVHFVGKDQEALATSLIAIAELHDQHQLPNPTATACVRAALAQTLELTPPRSWTKAEKLLFSGLPAEVRAIVSHRDHQREKEMRRLQNELSELKRHGGAKPAIEEKEITK